MSELQPNVCDQLFWPPGNWVGRQVSLYKFAVDEY